MAKYVKSFMGDYQRFINYIEEEVIGGSMSATLEDKQKTIINDVVCTVLVFERYSYMGANRVSMNLTVLGYNGRIDMIAITAGGSQATFFKVNTFGEEAFLNKLIDPVTEYIQKYGK